MKNPEYNLLDEPWIPVRLVDGTITDVGLLELLRRTTDIADLACELPTQSIAIQRLILAIAYRVATPRDARDWARQWDEGAPTEQMIEYLERWRDRFYLFGGRFPFMQVADLRTEKDEEKNARCSGSLCAEGGETTFLDATRFWGSTAFSIRRCTLARSRTGL